MQRTGHAATETHAACGTADRRLKCDLVRLLGQGVHTGQTALFGSFRQTTEWNLTIHYTKPRLQVTRKRQSPQDQKGDSRALDEKDE